MSIGLDILIGCTASGKGQVGLHLARQIGAEIVSVDSMKVYRGMDIGTAKPSAEARRRVRYHLIDVVDPSESFSVARYVELADEAIADVADRGRRVLAVGGTPLYAKALTEGLFAGPSNDPEVRQRLRAEAQVSGALALHRRLARVDPVAAERIHPNDLRRIERALEVHELTGRPISTLQTQFDSRRPCYDCRFVGILRGRQDQSHRINKRVGRMIEQGLVEEVRGLLAEGHPALSKQARQAVGYQEMIAHLEGRCSLAEAMEQIKINSRRLAKAQRTWFKRFAGVQWVQVEADESAEQIASRILPLISEPAA